jgi:hypothetical protein
VELGTTVDGSETPSPAAIVDDEFQTNLDAIPKDYSNTVLIRKRRKSSRDDDLAKSEEGTAREARRMEDLRVVAIRGKFNFVNYNNILRKLKTMVGGEEVTNICLL